jgi:ABC-type uncharacterized transport system substrate-binding protein
MRNFNPEWGRQGLAQSGWITGRNIRIETRWTKFGAEETRKYAAELVALASDAIVAIGNSTVGPLLQLTRTVPIVFPAASDPVAFGLVESLARPDGTPPDSIPVIGFLTTNRSDALPNYIAAFREGLAEAGFVEGKNVTIEFRFAEQHLERVPALAMDLIRRKVAVNLTGGGDVRAMVAKDASRLQTHRLVLRGDVRASARSHRKRGYNRDAKRTQSVCDLGHLRAIKEDAYSFVLEEGL